MLCINHAVYYRLLRLVDLPSLDGVIDHDAVDGKLIQSNASISGRGFIGKAAARLRRSVKPHDKKPPLPSHLHTLTTTHHHTRRFSTKINNETQSTTHTGELIQYNQSNDSIQNHPGIYI